MTLGRYMKIILGHRKFSYLQKYGNQEHLVVQHAHSYLLNSKCVTREECFEVGVITQSVATL